MLNPIDKAQYVSRGTGGERTVGTSSSAPLDIFHNPYRNVNISDDNATCRLLQCTVPSSVWLDIRDKFLKPESETQDLDIRNKYALKMIVEFVDILGKGNPAIAKTEWKPILFRWELFRGAGGTLAGFSDLVFVNRAQTKYILITSIEPEAGLPDSRAQRDVEEVVKSQARRFLALTEYLPIPNVEWIRATYILRDSPAVLPAIFDPDLNADLNSTNCARVFQFTRNDIVPCFTTNDFRRLDGYLTTFGQTGNQGVKLKLLVSPGDKDHLAISYESPTAKKYFETEDNRDCPACSKVLPIKTLKACPSSSLEPRRKRAHLSCAECRRLKLKCSRTIPCDSCIKRKCASLCPEGVKEGSGRVSKLALDAAALAERVALLEEQLRDIGREDLVPPQLVLKTGRNEAAGGASREGGDPVEVIQRGVGSLTVGEDGSSRFLGLCALMAFQGETELTPQSRIQQGEDSEGAEEDSVSPEDPINVDGINPSFPFASSPTTLLTLRAALPPYQEGIRLADLYWKYAIALFCPIDRNIFYSDYLPAAYSDSPHGPNLACVFLVLALGVQGDRNISAVEAGQQAFRYMTLGQAALSASQFLCHPTLAGVQALHICGNVYLNQHKPQESGETFFNLMGIAVKQVFTMGLHRDPTSWGLEEEEANRRRLIFWEVFSLDRLQALLSGRPYTIQETHFDTRMPTNANDYLVGRWKASCFIGRIIDELFSVKSPSYSVVQSLDTELRKLCAEVGPGAVCANLPQDSFVSGSRPNIKAQLTPLNPNDPPITTVMESHSLAMIHAALFITCHKIPFSQALEEAEPLQSPFAGSVQTILLEIAPLVALIGRSWTTCFDTEISTRWWTIYYHMWTAAVAQASLLIKAPSSLMVPQVWEQLNEICNTFEIASETGAPVIALLPRVRSLRQKAYNVLQEAQTIPHPLSQPTLPASRKVDFGTSTRLSRSRARSNGSKQLGSLSTSTNISPSSSSPTEYTPVEYPKPNYPQSSSQQNLSIFAPTDPRSFYQHAPPPPSQPLYGQYQQEEGQDYSSNRFVLPRPRESQPQSHQPSQPYDYQQHYQSQPPNLNYWSTSLNPVSTAYPAFGLSHQISPNPLLNGAAGWSTCKRLTPDSYLT
ncbi:hypothetical protein JCM5353_001557 [Sporobolomyces roseus]